MAMTTLWRRHKQWVTNVRFQRGGFRELISGSRNGEVKLWDIRFPDPVTEITAMEGGTMRTFDVHEHAPVFACGGEQGVSVWNVQGEKLNTIRPYSPILSTKSAGGPIVSTAFHPHSMQLAMGSLGHGNVEVFTCGGKGID